MITKLRFTLLFSLLGFCLSQAQVNFESGYYIDSDGNRIDGLILNEDWNRNPKNFRFKKNENAETYTLETQDVREFAVMDKLKYLSREVHIDRSTDSDYKIGKNRNPTYEKDTLFLKVLAEGRANLYQYLEGPLNTFFLSTETDSISQLIRKPYQYGNGLLRYNNQYRQQLLNQLNQCSKIKQKVFADLEYNRKDITKLFEEYNSCGDPALKVAEQTTKKKGAFHLRVTPGINLESIEYIREVYDQEIYDFGNASTFRIGLEAEFILPFNRNKWSLFLEPSYHTTYEKDISYNVINRPDPVVITARFQSIEGTTGIRHYMFLNDKNKLFVNAALYYYFPLDSSIDINFGENFENFHHGSANAGVGYSYNSKLSAEIRWYLNRNTIEGSMRHATENSKISFIFGYTLF